jgi:ketosteroid isomerase-like protein
VRTRFLWIVCLSAAGCASQGNPVKEAPPLSADSVLAELVALERAALDRWIRVDPDGYLGLYAPEITYFDPMREKRVDGLPAMEAIVAPLRGMKSPITDPRYDMIDPKVQLHGDVALLTFNLVNYGKPPNGQETVLARWNSTEVYRRIDGNWKIIHSHWSFVKPDVKGPVS